VSLKPLSAGAAGGGTDTATKVVAVAASAGGVYAVQYLLAKLPKSFPAAVVVLLHLPPDYRSVFHEILARVSELPVKQAEEGDVLRAGQVYVAPPDRHVSVNADQTLSLLDTARVHFVRPSADVLFTSLAMACHAHAIAIVLTGMGSDGTPGVSVIKRMGGTVIAQDRATSQFFGMPSAAIETQDVDRVLPLDGIPGALIGLVGGGP
jgi:two-component system chemotaxis response regulator CheB